MAVTVTANFSAAKQLIEQMKSLKEKAVYVGFPAEFDEKVKGSENFNLASLAAVLEFGNEHIPARPFLRQTFEENQEKYTALFIQWFDQGVPAAQIYERLSVMAQGDVQMNIVKGEWVANAKSTIRRKKSSKPLIDTGKMRQSVRGIVK
ncbi:phage-related protein [Aggregatibacter phage S1249]|uniref:tail completion or Neck1 protein n=1 Tax=Aggregatibacter phage S1249 TaxID=683735 RepID=UPI0001BA14F9|nr:tail completion or Neck1 protein [Aggregatibacter phage S1249]ACX80299.1 phage-related protein [Aggregatibacter phage S1249]